MINPHHLLLQSDYQWKQTKAIKYEFEKAIAAGTIIDEVIHPKIQIYTSWISTTNFVYFHLKIVWIGNVLNMKRSHLSY